MKHHSTSRQHRRWLITLVLLGAALRLVFALLPLPAHLLLLEDDAWMVTAIARNWALGLGITADGVYPTNGFHPLYTLTLGALPYVIAPEQLDWGFTASLVICALLAVLVCWPLYRLTLVLGGPMAALLAVGLYALNPFMTRLTVNGMETAAALLMLLTTLLLAYTLDLERTKANLLLALCTALMILTRLDGALVFAAIAGARLLTLVRTRQLRQGLPLLALYIGVTFALLGPYFWRNYAVFGSLSPSSGTALSYLHSYAGAYALSNPLQAVFYNSAVAAEWLPGPAAALGLVLLVAGAVGWVLRGKLIVALPILIYLVLPPLYYGYLQQQTNSRYVVGWSVLILILLSWTAALWWQRRPSRPRLLAILGGAVTIIALNSGATWAFWHGQRTASGQTQPTNYAAALWIRDNLPADAVLGAKNSGIFQYYAGHTVINIDGKLNHEVLPALEQRRLLGYLRAKGITHLVDRETTMADHVQFYSAEFGPAPNHRLPSTVERVQIYATLLGNTLGLNDPPALDRREGFVPNQPFSSVAPVIQRFPRPNDPRNPVVIYQIKP